MYVYIQWIFHTKRTRVVRYNNSVVLLYVHVQRVSPSRATRRADTDNNKQRPTDRRFYAKLFRDGEYRRCEWMRGRGNFTYHSGGGGGDSIFFKLFHIIGVACTGSKWAVARGKFWRDNPLPRGGSRNLFWALKKKKNRNSYYNYE